jgi:hypothetical protein
VQNLDFTTWSERVASRLIFDQQWMAAAINLG